MGKKSKAHLHDMTMFALSRTILLVGVQAGKSMRDANVTKKGIKLLIFHTPIRLDSKDLAIKLSLNQVLEFKEILKHLRFRTKQIVQVNFL
jgi:hypothetical protein